LVDRVSRRSHRPLLVGRDPREVLTELSAKRNPIYAEADLRISSNAAPHASTVKLIMEALKPWIA
jgi:shikimate kinase